MNVLRTWRGGYRPSMPKYPMKVLVFFTAANSQLCSLKAVLCGYGFGSTLILVGLTLKWSQEGKTNPQKLKNR
jgi:hypothetical protein